MSTPTLPYTGEDVSDWLDLVAQISSEMPERRTEEVYLIAAILLISKRIRLARPEE